MAVAHGGRIEVIETEEASSDASNRRGAAGVAARRRSAGPLSSLQLELLDQDRQRFTQLEPVV